LNDVIIGCVKTTKPEISYLEYKSLLKRKILRLVALEVKENMSSGMSHSASIQEVADTVYSFLHIAEKFYPLNEEEIVEQILDSAQFKNWDTEVYYNFLGTHEGVVTTKTPIEVGGTIENLKDEYETESNLADLLQALSSSYNT
jgi:hypothetical protein